MYKDGKVLGIIPARGGSKRLPRKNIASLAGKPSICWTIDSARASTFIDKTVVSTENEEIAEIARRLGCVEVIKRTDALASDEATINDVVTELLSVYKKRGQIFEYIILLQPTSPLRTSDDIDKAFKLMEVNDARGVVSICRTEHPVEWMGNLSPDGFLDSFFLQTKLDRQSQEFLPSYQINGAIYIVPVDQFLEEKTFFLRKGVAAYVMDRASSVDIDDEYDLQLAAWLLNRREESVADD
mgnify:CR=1 FL=1